jgi:hypothetical protein
MKGDWLSPNTGAGLRPTPGKDSSTGPQKHGEILNPPRLTEFGGMRKLNIIGYFRNQMKLKKPGSDQNG